MDELVQFGGAQPHQLPQHTFQTASSYYQALAETHMIHLSSQRNDAIDSAEDCRQKHIARYLFRKITREDRLCDNDSGPFKLFCDDLRRANVLANENHLMTGDWQSTILVAAWTSRALENWLRWLDAEIRESLINIPEGA